jgi:hypothetical protein
LGRCLIGDIDNAAEVMAEYFAGKQPQAKPAKTSLGWLLHTHLKESCKAPAALSAQPEFLLLFLSIPEFY